jgi:hypothetical protein
MTTFRYPAAATSRGRFIRCSKCNKPVDGFRRDSAETPDAGFKLLPCECDTTSEFVASFLAVVGQRGGGSDNVHKEATKEIAELYGKRDKAQRQLRRGERTLGLADRINNLTEQIRQRVMFLMEHEAQRQAAAEPNANGDVFGPGAIAGALGNGLRVSRQVRLAEDARARQAMQRVPSPRWVRPRPAGHSTPTFTVNLNQERPPELPRGLAGAMQAELQQLIDAHTAGLLENHLLIERAYERCGVSINVVTRDGQSHDILSVRRGIGATGGRPFRDDHATRGRMPITGGLAAAAGMAGLGGVASGLGAMAFNNEVMGTPSRPVGTNGAPPRANSPQGERLVALCWITWLMRKKPDYNSCQRHEKDQADRIYSAIRIAMQNGEEPRLEEARQFIGKLNQFRNRYRGAQIPRLNELFTLNGARPTTAPLPNALGQPLEADALAAKPQDHRKEFLDRTATKKRRKLIRLKEEPEDGK